MSLDDKTLIRRVVASGDQHAFGELVKRYQSQLRYSLRQLTGWDEALADDLAQETFLKVYRSLHQFRGDAKFFTWLYRIAYHCFIAHKRVNRLEYVSRETDTDNNSCATDQALDLHRDLARAMVMLSPQQRMAIHLSLHKEFSHQEVAEIMRLPLGTVKSHIQRGKMKLQELLSSWQ